MLAVTNIDRNCENGELDAGDPNVRRLRTALNNAALDILLNDTYVRETVEKRALFRMKDLSLAEKDHVRGLAEVAVAESTERLGSDMASDGQTATDEEAPQEEKRRATYRFGSRIIRMWDLSMKSADGVNKFAKAAQSVKEVVGWFL